MDFIEKTPDNINELVRKAGDKKSWKNRMDAVRELSKWKCKQSIDVVTRLALHDLVFDVKECAFRAAQSFGVKKNGKPIRLEKKPKGKLIKDINKKIYRVVNNLGINQETLNIDEFKDEFKKLYPEAFDVYQYEKNKKFDEWIKNMVITMPKDKLKK